MENMTHAEIVNASERMKAELGTSLQNIRDAIDSTNNLGFASRSLYRIANLLGSGPKPEFMEKWVDQRLKGMVANIPEVSEFQEKLAKIDQAAHIGTITNGGTLFVELSNLKKTVDAKLAAAHSTVSGGGDDNDLRKALAAITPASSPNDLPGLRAYRETVQKAVDDGWASQQQQIEDAGLGKYMPK